MQAKKFSELPIPASAESTDEVLARRGTAYHRLLASQIATLATANGAAAASDLAAETAARAAADTALDGRLDALEVSPPAHHHAALVVAAATWTGSADYRCDGVDDQIEIQAAIDALGAQGGAIMLTPGTFVVARAGTVTSDGTTHPYAIRVPDTIGPVMVRGAGRDATVIRLADGQLSNTIPLLIRGTSSAAKRTAPTRIADLTIDGNKEAQPGWTDFAALEIAYADHVQVERCGVVGGKIHGCQVYRDSRHVRVRACMFSGSTNAQLRLESHDAHVTGCTFDLTGASGAGVEVMVNADIDMPAQDVLVQGNTFFRFLTAITVSGARRVVIANNLLLNGTQGDASSQWGIDILPYTSVGAYDCLDTLVVNNSIYNCRNGVRVRSTGTRAVRRCTVRGNRIVEGYSGDPFGNVALNVGIAEVNTAGDNTDIDVEDNAIDGATVGISLASPSATQRRNTIDGVVSDDDATLLQGRPLSSAAPADTNVIAWSAASGQWQPTAVSGGGGALVASGRPRRSAQSDYSLPGVGFVGAISVTLTANRLYYYPFVVSTTISIDQLALVDVLTADGGTPGALAVGIVSMDTDWQPTARVIDAGTLSLATTGAKSLALGSPFQLTPGRYAVAANSNTGTAILRAYTGISPASSLVPGGGANAIRTAMFVARTYDGTIPAAPPAWTGDGAGNSPFVYPVFLRVSTP
jgi:hypothetical protein